MKRVFFFLCLFAMVSCKSLNINTDGVSLDIIGTPEIIDVSSAFTQKVMIDDIVHDVHIIKLETNEESVLAHILQVEVTDKYLYVRDMYKGGSVAIFDKDGNFVKRLPKGSGPQEIDMANAMYFEPKSLCLYVHDDTSEKVVKYTQDGDYISSYYIDDIIIGDVALDNGKMLLYQGNLQNRTGLFTLTEIDTTSKSRKNFYLGNGHFDYIGSKHFLQCDDGYLIVVPWGNTIFRYKNGKVYKKYVITNINADGVDYSLYEYDFEMRNTISSNAWLFYGMNQETKNFQILEFCGKKPTDLKKLFRNKWSKEWYEIAFSTSLYGYINVGNVYDYNNDRVVGVLFPEYLLNEKDPQYSYDFSNPHDLISPEDMEKLKSVKPDDNPLVITYRLKFDK
ncbi:MAG: 6-bladed beta-propeller [Bacteroidales bacterium]|nr:6-bladed beta-propeller [Bacteroidales bacterium]